MAATILQLLLIGASVALTQSAEPLDCSRDPVLAERLEGMERLMLQLTTENVKLRETVSFMASENHKLRLEQATEMSQLKEQFAELRKRFSVFSQMSLPLEQFSIETPSQVLTNNQARGESKITPVRDVSARSDDAAPLEPVVTQLAQRVTEISADVQALKAVNTQQDAAIQHAGSSVYVRWGNAGCPNSAELVYTGVIGGSHEDQPGAASNYLCLSMAPVFSDRPVSAGHAYLYGGEYETYDSVMEKDPVCSVCRSRHATAIMVPGTNVCLPGWSTEYTGFLMAGHYAHTAASEFICVDSALDYRISSDADQNGKLLYFTVTQCGTLPCAPYINSKTVTCAVCSK